MNGNVPESPALGADAMSLSLSLRAVQRNTLLHYYRRYPDPAVRQRAHIILMLAEGHPWSLITSVLYCSARTVAHWKHRFEDGGVDAIFGRPRGAPASWSDEAEAILQKALEHSPDEWGYRAVNWTVSLLRDHIQEHWGQRPSDRQLRIRLRELDYVWKRPRHALRESKSPRVLRRLRAIRKKVRSLPADCAKLFEDETDLLLFPPLRAGWFKRGKPAEVPISGENAKRTVFGTIDVETGQRIFVARDGACAPDFQVILRLIRQGYGDRKVALLLDGASRHSAHYSEWLAADLDIELIYLPARCININPMDRLWKWGKDKICANKQYLSIDYQADRFIEYLLDLSPQEALRKAGILSGRFWLFR
jgi:putative transposase